MGKFDNCQCETCRRNRTLEGLTCESPIERQLAEALLLYTDGKSGLRLKSQYHIGPYRYDFAILEVGDERPIILVECDGKDFHSSEDQISNDHNKDMAALVIATPVIRFTGSEIFRNPWKCADWTMDAVKVRQILRGRKIDELSPDDQAMAGFLARKHQGWRGFAAVFKAYVHVHVFNRSVAV